MTPVSQGSSFKFVCSSRRPEYLNRNLKDGVNQKVNNAMTSIHSFCFLIIQVVFSNDFCVIMTYDFMFVLQSNVISYQLMI